MFRSEISIPNNTNDALVVWVEPWAFAWKIPGGVTCKFIADSDTQGEFELVDKNGELEVYGWAGCNLKIFMNDVLELEEELLVPNFPEMSTRGWVEMLFANNPLTASPRIKD